MVFGTNHYPQFIRHGDEDTIRKRSLSHFAFDRNIEIEWNQHRSIHKFLTLTGAAVSWRTRKHLFILGESSSLHWVYDLIREYNLNICVIHSILCWSGYWKLNPTNHDNFGMMSMSLIFNDLTVTGDIRHFHSVMMTSLIRIPRGSIPSQPFR